MHKDLMTDQSSKLETTSL